MLLAIVLSFFLLDSVNYNPTYWEELSQSQKEDILNDDRIPKIVRSYYYGCMSATDDDNTFALLDVISSPNNKNEEMLYLHLLSQICIHADGALSEVLGAYCIKMVLSDPDYVLAYIIRDESLSTMYESYIGYELAMSEVPDDAYKSFSNSIKSKARLISGNELNTFLAAIFDALMSSR